MSRGRSTEARIPIWSIPIAMLLIVAMSAARVLPVGAWLSAFGRHRLARSVVAAASELPYRTIEGRLSIDSPHRPLLGVRRGASSDPSIDPRRIKLLAVTGEIRQSLDLSRDNISIIAAADLLSGKEDRAVQELETVLLAGRSGELGDTIARSSDAELLIDLAAAYLARSHSRSRLSADLLSATACATRSYALAPESAVAAWNRALVLDGIGLAPEARSAWNDYLAIDRNSDWSDEARRHLEALRWESDSDSWEARVAELQRTIDGGNFAPVASIAVHFPIRMKQHVEREWIPRWSDATVRRDATAGRLLEAIDVAGRAIAESSHDQQIAEWYDAASRSPDRPAFARAHGRLVAAQKAFVEKGTLDAIAILRVSLAELERVHSPTALSVAVEIGGRLYHAGKHGEAIDELDAVDRALAGKDWPLLEAKSAWNRAVALTSLGAIGRASESYMRAIRLYRESRDETFTGMLEMLVGHNAEYAADLDEAWPRYVDGLRLAERYGDSDRVIVVLDTFCRAALRNGQPGVASLLNDALMVRAQAPSFAAYRCHALITRCEIDARAGDRREAAAQCAAAKQVFVSIPDAAVRDRLEADLELATANASPRELRIESLSRAVDVSSARADLYRLSRVLLQRGRAHLEAGAPRMARADFERALAAIEEERQKLERVPDKLTYFETSRGVAEELVRLLVHGREELEALRVVDRVRARMLLDRIADSSSGPIPSIDESLARLEPRRAVVEYWADRDELFVWIVRREGVAIVRVPVARALIGAAADRFVASLGASVVSHVDGESLFLRRHLVTPLASHLVGVDTITVVPDERFGDVPFAALRNDDGHYLVEQFTLTRTPCLAAFALTHDALVRRDSILVVADPRTVEPLPALDVRREVTSAMRAARNGRLLEGRDATPAAVSIEAAGVDMVHIAAHAFDRSPFGEPALALSPDTSHPDGLLAASDVERNVTLRRGALVVLAACSTARGRKSSEGVMSLARAFLAAGAGSVISSLWPASDADSARIFTAFYESISRGTSPAAALRDAQLTLLKSDPHASPQRWAAYQIFGGA